VKAAGFPGQILLPGRWILLEDSPVGCCCSLDFMIFMLNSLSSHHFNHSHCPPGACQGQRPFLQDSVHFLPYSDTQLCHFDLIGTAAQLFLGWCPAVAKLCQTKDEEGGF